MERRTQHVWFGNAISHQLEYTSGVPQVSLVVILLLFCIFIIDLPESLKFSDPYIIAEDLKIIAVVGVLYYADPKYGTFVTYRGRLEVLNQECLFWATCYSTIHSSC